MLAIASFGLQSCLHDNEEVFDKSAAERIDDAVANAKNVLTSAQNGWRFEYYLGSDYAYGGYNFLAKFGKDGKAQVSGEIAPSDMVTVSSWDVIKDQGPVLTFDTYNEIMHYLAQPYQDQVDGYEGDYEFIIMKVTNDSIYLKGKKWGNDMLLTRMPESVTWVDYLNELTTMSEDIWAVYDGTIDGKDVEAELDTNEKWMYVTIGDSEIEAPYIITSKGLKLNEPVEMAGTNVQFFTYDSDNMVLTADENSNIKFNAVIPEDWLPFDAFEGTYNFKYSYGTFPVQLIKDKANNRYLLRGLSKKFDIVMTYSRSAGTLLINAQQVGVDENGVAVWLACWDLANGGSLTWSNYAGVALVWNMDAENPVYTFRDQGNYPGIVTDSFILWGTVNGSSNGIYAGQDWWAAGASSGRIPYIESLTKVNE